MFYAFFLKDNLLFTGSLDKTIKVWNLSDGTSKPYMTLKGHNSAIDCICMAHIGQFLVSASSDKTLKLWDINTGKCLYTLQGQEWIYCLGCDDNYLVFGSAASGELKIFKFDHDVGFIEKSSLEKNHKSCLIQ